MKNLLTIVLLFVATALQAQKLKWHFGPTASLNLSAIEGKGMSKKMVAGLQAGGFAQLVLNSKWSIQPEVVYTDENVNKGNDFLTYYNVDGRVDAFSNLQLNYISIPILARFDLNKKVAFMAGPQYGYLFNSYENLSRTGIPGFKKSNLSANVQAQFKIDNVGFFVRYNQGITNINNLDNRYKWRTVNLQIGTSVAIR